MPNFLLKFVLFLVRNTIKKKAKFDVYELNLIKKLKKCHHSLPPALFIVSKEDSFIPYKHTEVSIIFRMFLNIIPGSKIFNLLQEITEPCEHKIQSNQVLKI